MKAAKKMTALLIAAIMLLAMCSCGAEDVLEAADAIVEGLADSDAYKTEESSDGALVIDDGVSDGTADAVDQASTGEDTAAPVDDSAGTDAEETIGIDEHGSYTTKDDVALYIHTYGRLPENFITKKEAQELGWSGGSLEPYAPGKCIGGSRFGNYEGLLPSASGRTYYECDIDTLGASSRGAKRIVYSNDGLIYYTEDHYASFELLYGEG